ncbi:DNA-3-methyladenine glycosylase 2 [Escherichia sp. E2593]|uniref:DNA-3-methyladenine glycosylase 2 n=1 Tax=unclassified Escherichia TaxID=2608889 RepID=UPI0010291D00|nr:MULTISPECIES: DNA-3-methyladenine glycosylase 2 [unclassified Escherichia]RZN42073.1 DNA-3-methyladenine glycosylase 2 [Escherichia sp. E10V5]TBR68673.1 DNA-3-methyladenine glycosylase 2 [Escherichia sp. E10V4]TGC02312.1 DNA-3-methyladenine glycosylase 2 [Escherichia sp. E2586]TGC07819.1 DNA-3-methyladenine glycosylase 2 [Escherichia sp. E2593]TLI75196.1 DNA-3-methyladenine glycosylase 2 [Escherichia sp. E2586]
MYTLNWQPPYDWSWMLGFLAARAVSGVETIADDYYARSLAVGEYRGVVTAIPDIARHTLHINLSAGLESVAAECLAKMSRLFDLQCNPQIVNEALGELGAARPGLRLPGCVDAFEQGVRAILGQLVSVAMAAKLTAKVAQLYGERLDDFPDYVCFPTPQRLAAADPQALKALGMPLKRAEALIHLANAALDGTLPMTIPDDVEQAMKTLQTYPGVGRWTANYFALRGWQAKDVFLPDDYLIKQRFPGMTPAQIRRYAERWKPWRSYALLHIWYTEGWQPEEV